MRRAFTLMAAVGLIAAGIGCKHVGGVCDCATHPDNAVLPPATNPYAVVGTPVTSIPTADKPATGEKMMEKAMPPGK